MAMSIWVAPARCWWMCRERRHLIWWSNWAKTVRRISLTALTSAASGPPVASAQVSGTAIIQAAASYRTNQGTYVVFRSSENTLAAFRITAANPPGISPRWNVGPGNTGWGSPFVTSTDGTNNMIVWLVSAFTGAGQRLYGYDGDTGAVVYTGGGPNELMANTRKWNTGIVARGRIYFAPPATKSMLLPCR